MQGAAGQTLAKQCGCERDGKTGKGTKSGLLSEAEMVSNALASAKADFR